MVRFIRQAFWEWSFLDVPQHPDSLSGGCHIALEWIEKQHFQGLENGLKISLLCTKTHAACSGLTSFTVRLGAIVSPSISQRNCWEVSACTSEADRGH